MKRLSTFIVLLYTLVLSAMADGLPFKTTTIVNGEFADDTEWYLLRADDKWYVMYEDYITAWNQFYPNNSAYWWCFVRNGETIKIYNKKAGPSKAMTQGGFSTEKNGYVVWLSSKGNDFTYSEENGLCIKKNRVVFTATGSVCLRSFKSDGYKINILSNNDYLAGLKKAEDDKIQQALEKAKTLAEAPPFKMSELTENGLASNATFYYIKSGKYYFYVSPGLTYDYNFSYETSSDKYLWAFVPSDIDGFFYIYNKADVKSYGINTQANKDLYYWSKGKLGDIDHQQFRRYNSLTEFPAITFEEFSSSKVEEKQKQVVARQAQAAKDQESAKRKTIATVGQSNFNMLMNNQMPKGITIAQLDAYATYIHTYYEETEYDIRFKQLNNTTWRITLGKSNNAAKYEDRVMSYCIYRINLVGGRVSSYTLLK